MEGHIRGNSALLSRVRRSFFPLFVLKCISLLLQLLGLATTGWYIMDFGFKEVYIGLWLVKECSENSCQTKSFEEFEENGMREISHTLTQYRVETVFGLILICSAIVAGGLSRHRVGHQAAAFSVLILSLISGILALIASGNVARDTRKTHDLLVKHKDGDSPVRFPYSVFLTGVGGILACITSLIGLCYVRPCASESEPSSAIQMSTNPPLQLAAQAVSQPLMTQSTQASPTNAYVADVRRIGQHESDNFQYIGNDLEPIVSRI